MDKLKERIIELGKNSNYEAQGIEFVKATELNITCVYAGKKRYFPEDTQERDVWEIVIRRGNKHIRITYGDSLKNTEKNWPKRIKPSAYSIICGLEKYEPDTDIDSFASDFGIEKPSEAVRIHKAVIDGWRDVCEMFSDEEIEAMREIS